MHPAKGKLAIKRNTLNGNTAEQEYRVGPGHPPRQYQFKPGQSGNPKGAPRKKKSVVPDLKALLERALNERVTLRQGEKERIVSKAAAGIEQLVNQYAKGDRYARRDLIDLASKLGVELVAGQDKNIEKAVQADVTANDVAVLANFVESHGGKFNHRGAGSKPRPRKQISERPHIPRFRPRLVETSSKGSKI